MVARVQRQQVFRIVPAEHRTGLKSYWIGRGVRTHFAQQRDNMISRLFPLSCREYNQQLLPNTHLKDSLDIS